jgi:thiol-disulfide isomerase/thioredoxin
MKITLVILLISAFGFLGLVFSDSQATEANKEVKPITIAELQQRLENTNGELIVCNFWATWCKPCIEEMPYFEELQAKYANQKVKVLFVSLDRPSTRQNRVEKFVNSQGIQSEVVLLDEPNLSQDEWISLINKDWEGDIPATLYVNASKNISQFHTGSYENFAELEEKVKSILAK